MTILIADPSAAYRTQMEQMLRKAPIALEVLNAETAGQVATILKSAKVDLALVNPDLDAMGEPRGTFRHLREARPRPLTIALLNSKPPSEAELIRTLGVHEMVIKPVDGRLMARLLYQVRSHQRARQIMLIGGDADQRGHLQSTLSKTSFPMQVQSYDHLAPALDDLALFVNDAVFVDVDTLPGGTYALLADLRKLLPNGAVIGVSNDRDPKTRMRVRGAGATGYLVRPATVQDVEAVLAEQPSMGRLAARTAA